MASVLFFLVALILVIRGEEQNNKAPGFKLPSVALDNQSIGKFGKGIAKEIQTVKQPIDETVAYIGSTQCSKVKKLIGVSYEQLDGEKEPDLNQLTLEYRQKAFRTIFNITTAAEYIPDAQGFNPKNKLVIFIHGFTDDPTSHSFGNISDAYLNRDDYNVLALDGSSLIKWLYLHSTTYVRFMGEKLGSVLASMVKNGANPSAIHIVGHSLGSHISGFTGKTFTSLTGKKVGRITGLDPAGPCFSHIDTDLRLKDTDAEFVDVIHSDAGVYGMKDIVGQVDYFPNSGSEQPGCLLQTCSHSRAWVYFSESVENPKGFPAVKCGSWEDFKNKKCDSDISYMGELSKPGTRGTYYLQTNDQAPYARETDGMKFKNNEGYIKTAFNILG